MDWDKLKLFQEPKHRAFIWPGGQAAALLVHGFPGTPAEVRPIAELLQPMGWTVQALLVPGFGEQFRTLGEQRYEDWIAAIVEALMALRAAHRPLLLAGFSMGGALAISAAAMAAPEGLLLLAPFSWPEGLTHAAGHLVSPFLPRAIRPFRSADLNNVRVRMALLAALPGIDLEDPEVREAARELVVPTALVRQVFRTGRRAYRHAAELRLPALVIQGKRDETVLPARTRALAGRLGNEVRYLEVDAGHRLIGEQNLAWPTVQEAIMDFAVRLEERYQS